MLRRPESLGDLHAGRRSSPSVRFYATSYAESGDRVRGRVFLVVVLRCVISLTHDDSRDVALRLSHGRSVAASRAEPARDDPRR